MLTMEILKEGFVTKEEKMSKLNQTRKIE